MQGYKNELSEGVWSRTIGNTKYTYDVPTLLQFVKEKGYEVFDLPLDGIDLSWNPFSTRNISEFIFQVKRINNTSLEYPILIDDLGTICDGWHRVAKAILEGKKTIKAIRMNEMPDASGTETL
jgi:hypothetical protein